MDRISSVSGGSITAAVLALAWDRLGYGAGTVVAGNFEEVVSRPVRELASRTIDIGAILKAPALLGRRVGPRGGLPTRLAAMDLRLQGRLINWGYAVCDSAVRSFYERDAPTPASLPYPATGV